MKPEPLKDKGFRVLKVLNNKEYLIDKGSNELFHREKIKSAVEWLKREIRFKIETLGDDELIQDLIDEAFEGVIK